MSDIIDKIRCNEIAQKQGNQLLHNVYQYNFIDL